jgi:hypothetical protein
MVLSSVVIGCGGPPADMPELGEVSGIVTVGGTPLAGATVNFSPTGEGRPSAAVTDNSGHYTLQYTSEYAGAAVGEHIVTVTAAAAEGDYESEDDGDSGLPPAASDRSLKKTVKAGPNDINIDL